MRSMKSIFHDHPAKVGESYFEHLIFAFGFGWRLIKAGVAAMVHGVIPAVHETTASSVVLAMNDDLRARRGAMAKAAARDALAR